MMSSYRGKIRKVCETLCVCKLCVIILGSLVLIALPASGQQTKETKRVLILITGQLGVPGYEIAREAMESSLGKSTNFQIELFVEYMDFYRFDDASYNKTLLDWYKAKYAGINIDLVIAYGYHALAFAAAHGDEIFPHTPIVFSAVLQNQLSRIKNHIELTGSLLKIDYLGLLNTALNNHPGTRHVVVVSGSSKAGRLMEGQIREVYEPYKDKYDFIYLGDLAMRDLLPRLAKLPEHTVVIYYYLALDGNGQEFKPWQAAAMVSEAANAPTYGMADTYMGHGIVGGALVSWAAHGKEAGQIGLRILNGANPADIPISSEGTTLKMFDWRQLKRWGIPEDRLPPGSIVRFKTYSFWELYRWYIVAAFFLILVQSGLISFLLKQRVQRRRSQDDLAKRLRFEKMLSALSARFVNLPPERVDPEIRRVLESIGKVFDLDRVSIFEVSENDQKLHLVHSYKNADIKAPLSEIPFEQLPWARQKLFNGETLIFSDSEDLPAEAGAEKNFLRAQGIISVAAIPLSTGKKTLGQVG